MTSFSAVIFNQQEQLITHFMNDGLNFFAVLMIVKSEITQVNSLCLVVWIDLRPKREMSSCKAGPRGHT